jgi:hypothetical protein
MRRILGLGCFLALLLLAAIPASADVLTSSMKTGLYSVLPNQILSLSVADVATTSEGGTLTLEAYDENGVQLEQLQQPLHAGQALSLQIRGDGYVYDGPTLQVRFVVILSRKTEAGMVPITTLSLIDMDNLTTAERLKCTGPAAEEEGPIFNIDCPGVAQSGETTP